MGNTPILRPADVRRPGKSFGWIDHKLIRDGHLARLSCDAIALYTFLVLVANRYGVSYYGAEKICRHLDGMTLPEFLEARACLEEAGLICFRPFRSGDLNGFYQVLCVPSTREGEDDGRG